MHHDPPAHGLLKNPLILGGLAVVGLLLIIAGVLSMITTGNGESGDNAQGSGSSSPTRPGNTATPKPGSVPRTIRTTSVRSGPSPRNPVFGTIPSGAALEVTGRNADGSWLEIRYPPGSNLKGWVDSHDVDIPGDAMAFAVATPQSLPPPNIPTLPPGRLKTPIAYTPEPTEPASTPTPAGLPDLVIGIPVSFIGGSLVVTVINQGAGPAVGTIQVAIFDPARQALLGGAPAPVTVLPPGAQTDVFTGFTGAIGVSRVLITVNAGRLIAESSYSNNQYSLSLAKPTATPAAGPSPSPAPSPTPPPPWPPNPSPAAAATPRLR